MKARGRAKKQPSYRLHKATGRGCVELNGRTIYFGPHGSPESRASYNRCMAEWEEKGRAAAPELPPRATAARPDEMIRSLTQWLQSGGQGPLPAAVNSGCTVDDLIDRFLTHAESHYTGAAGTPTREVKNIRYALIPLAERFGTIPAVTFGPNMLRQLQEWMVGEKSVKAPQKKTDDEPPAEPRRRGGRRGAAGERRWCRNVINQRIGIVRRMFRWAVSHELIPSSVIAALDQVEGVESNRGGVRETDDVDSVPEADVRAALPFLTPVQRAMVQVQRLTGCRPGEVVQLRVADLDRKGLVWLYRPRRHKNSWRGKKHERVIPVGPRAQVFLAPYLSLNREAPVFSVARSEEERSDARHASRKTPPSSHQNRQRRRRADLREEFTVDAYGLAIRRACLRADVPVWAPNQLRHAAAEEARDALGPDGVQARLGHARGDLVDRYARLRIEKAVQVAEQLG